VIDGICENCGAHLVGDYCHLCGQREIDGDWQSIGAILRHRVDLSVNVEPQI
jgi:RNA polymerase subunit RPABC4/transcription elongation factor Spt4